MEVKPDIFEFTSYKFEPESKRAVFNYRQNFKGAEAINFTETLLLPEVPVLNDLPSGLVDKILQNVHIIVGISYYKFYCATEVKIPYLLTKREADFWDIVYKKGLGEFYFKNNLNPNKSPRFSYSKTARPKNFRIEKNNKCLVSVSGGKDSIVAAELFKDGGFDLTAIFTEAQRESEIVNNVINKLGLKSLKFRRMLDHKISDQHKYNGHVPVSAMFAFLGILYAVLYKHSYCVMANEYSSNFGNTKYKGEVINHQWSKSSEFENLFSDYVKNFITPDVKYFSLLRPFYEIRIAEMFCEHKKYFSYFSSCNKNFTVEKAERHNLWCGECPKCVFAFTLLSAFLGKEELLGVFKKNLYQDSNLLPLFRDVLGLGKMKPFDCVGTFEESRASFKMGSKNFRNDFIIKTLLPKIMINQNQIDELFRTHKSLNIPARFRFLGMKSALILGYGKEGNVTEKYLKSNYRDLKIGKADKDISKDYMSKQNDFDIVVKTPGIPKKKVDIQYTTATNIFFSEIKRNGNLVIGVTGSKGKSTTASLIYSILREAGKDVRLLGNIGEPMLGALLSPISKDEIFVVEFSSYQLDDIEFSPNIAVITNLFPEHMDYHSGLKNYYLSKKNITNFQDKKDVFIYNKSNKELLAWAKEIQARPVAFNQDSLSGQINSSLIGEHNKENILAAIAAVKEFNISDEAIKNAVEKFKPLPHRLEFVGKFKGIEFYDDAISTTPESTILAIKSLKKVDTIFLGGQDRGYNFKLLEKTIKKYKIRNAVVFPESGNRIDLKGLRVLKTKSMQKAVRFAYKNTEEGKICLLSCASPSYSLWKNFDEKGKHFKKLVKKLSK
jgi:UDP-N-acetylmuramoylalanine--D-glutamate ligase